MKALKVVGLIIGLVVVLGFVFRESLQGILMMMAIKPSEDFNLANQPAAPDYTKDIFWAALPDQEDAADVTPAGDFPDLQAVAAVDVFYIHPTTYLTSDSWNQPLDNAPVNDFTDSSVMRGQASAFNGCCRVFAPRYRQATIYSFMDTSGNGEQALNLAYSDVEAAFSEFIASRNAGRPFIIASHSQGSLHADKLIEEQIVGTDLQERLVAAYPIGYDVDTSNGLPVCESPEQTGCQISWNAVGPEPAMMLSKATSICVNPLTFLHNDSSVASSENHGGVSFDAEGKPEPGVANAACESDGRLTVSEINSPSFAARPMGYDNLHVFDYSLFYVNIRENAQLRVATYLASLAASADSTVGEGVALPSVTN